MPGGTIRLGILAGEASGDILGAHLIDALHAHYDEVIVEGMGGPLMEARGLSSLFPMERLSVMGLVEPLKRLPELLRIRGVLYQHFLDNPPDLFLGIDSPDFNLHLEYRLRKAGLCTAHLVSPSVWAWRRGRIRKIKRAIDHMFTLFPFETDIYRENGVPVTFVGHPLADEIPLQTDSLQARGALGLAPEGRILALMPGSRGGEVRMLAPRFLDAAERLRGRYPGLRFVIPAANQEREREIRALLDARPELPVTLVQGHSREVMAAADAVLLASGTATLEALLLKRPMVVAYRFAPLSWAIISRLVKTPFAALPNILAGSELVPELIQDAARPEAMEAALVPMLEGGTACNDLLHEYERIHGTLRLDFGARMASAIVEMLEGRPGD